MLMKKLFQRLTSPSKLNISLQDRLDDEEQLGRQVAAIFA